jgi:hypothetical protein
MPLTPAAQRERRAKLKPEPEYETKRCKNCAKFFKRVIKGRGSNKEFCTVKCKREFHGMGGNAFGPLKTKLEKLVKTWMRSYQQDTDQNIIAVRNKLDELAQSLDAIRAAQK